MVAAPTKQEIAAAFQPIFNRMTGDIYAVITNANGEKEIRHINYHQIIRDMLGVKPRRRLMRRSS